MKITNAHSLPEAVYNVLFLPGTPPIKGRYGVVDLCGAPLPRILKMQHWEEIEEDVSDKLFMLLGSSVHYVLEKGAPDSALAEEKLIVNHKGVYIVGVTDLYHNSIIEDWKVVSVFSFLLGDKPEWERQLNCYAWLLGELEFPVTGLRINAILRDWMKNKALRNPDYPAIPFQMVQVPLWEPDKASAYVEERIALHRAAEDTMTAPCCNDEERWAKPTTYAVMKKGNKKASRVLETREEAETWADFNLFCKFEIVERPGEYTRCQSYCVSRAVCQYNPYREEQKVACRSTRCP